MEKKIYDKFGTELCVGDTICFTLSMRIDQKPIVRATITGFLYRKTPDGIDYIQMEYIESSDVRWARLEKKLIKKVSSERVVKCY